jgi:hypothetical protein
MSFPNPYYSPIKFSKNQSVNPTFANFIILIGVS